MNDSFGQHITRQLDEIRAAGTYKSERVISTPQKAHIQVEGGVPVLNLCANNYLGLADHPAVVQAAHAALDRWGYGLSSVRFICGTQGVHKELEAALSSFLGTEDTILYGSCFDANGGLFEALLGADDAVISDELNHASIIDGIRLCKAQRFRYRNSDMSDLEVSGLGAIKHTEFAMASGEMTEAEFTAFLTQALGLVSTHSADGSLAYWCMDWRHLHEITVAGRAAYDALQNLCVWTKSNGAMGAFYRSQHELVFVFKKGQAAHRNNIQLGRFGRNRTNVWSYPGANSFGRGGEEGDLLAMHPTVKPVALVADVLLDASARGGLVLDPFLGSGSTLIAAEKVGRRAYGIEIDPGYVDCAIRRWERWTGKKARLEGSHKTFDQIAVERGAHV